LGNLAFAKHSLKDSDNHKDKLGLLAEIF